MEENSNEKNTGGSLTRAELLLYKANLIVHLIGRLWQKLEGTREQPDRQLLSYAVDAAFLLESAGKTTGKSTLEERACIKSADVAYERLSREFRRFIMKDYRFGLAWGSQEEKYLNRTAGKKEPSIEWIDQLINERNPAVVGEVAIALIEQIRPRLEDRMGFYIDEDLRELEVLRKENAALKKVLNELKPGYKVPKNR